MKVKYDFVTNSSSCSYIICIPLENIKEVVDIIRKKHPDIPNNLLDQFYANSVIYFGDRYYETFFEIHKIITDMNYVLKSMDMGPENEPIYYNVGETKILDKIKKILTKEKI